MHRKAAIPLFLGVLIIAFFFACSDDNNNPTYPFEKTVLEVYIAKRCTDCYIMIWRHPIEKKDLESYYVWLDTTIVKDSTQDISREQMNAASQIIPYNGKDENDSLDLTNLIKDFLDRDSLHIAIWAKYAGSEQGAVSHFYAHFGDDVPPSPPNISIDSISANRIWINWVRPTDQKDFYAPNEIDGPIAGYNVSIQAMDTTENIRNNAVIIYLAENNVTNSNLHRNSRFERRGREVALANATNSWSYFLGFAITDGEGFKSDNMAANNWKMEISGLRPERSYKISISAWDSAGNSNAPPDEYIKTTDEIPPLIASKFWLYSDSGDGLPRLDSNRLALFWPKSVDPLTNYTQIEIDSTLRIPANYAQGVHYREVKSYSIEQKNGSAWEAISRTNTIYDDYYNVRYSLENDSMILDSANGYFVSDTLNWILPGDTVILRIRAIDSSGYYSKAWIDTIIVSKGKLFETKCPPNFVPVKGDSSVFCIEKLQHYSINYFAKNVLYIEAKRECEEQGYHLCAEQEWNAACNSGGSSYGVIEERNFSPSEFLSRNCGVGAGDTLSAYYPNNRKKICASTDGVRDLPGQLQEWVVGADSSGKEIPLLKGSSYASFTGASVVELSLCRNRFTPTRIRPKYTTESVYLYRTGSRVDTLLEIDATRELYGVLPPSSFNDTILIYSLSRNGEAIGTDYVDQAEYNRRKGNNCQCGDDWLEVLWTGFSFALEEKRQVLILGTESIEASNIFLDPTVGFRCCAVPL